MACLGSYLMLNGEGLSEYMNDNWFDWPKSGEALKEKIRKCAKWDSFRINLYSI